MIPVQDALCLILPTLHPLGLEWIDLSQAPGRILGKPMVSDQDFPASATSSMDGYAVRSADLEDLPVQLAVVDSLAAGSVPQIPLAPGQAARILTGAILPEGADAVVMQENTQPLENQTVQILQGAAPGQFVRQPGCFCQRGTEVISRGQRLGGPEIAVLAALRRSTIPVFRQPRVGILSTGSELVRIDHSPQPGQLVDSNQQGLAALVRQAGGVPIAMGIVPDQPQILREQVALALCCSDVVISTGGVSVGDYDYVEQILEALGGEIRIRTVAIKPGKPLTFAIFPQSSGSATLYFGLPGNPVSAMVTFWRFLDPVLAGLQGQDPSTRPQFLTAIAQADLRSDGKRESYLWGDLQMSQEGIWFCPVASHNSGNLITLAGCTGLGILPVGQTQIKAGEPVRVLVIPR